MGQQGTGLPQLVSMGTRAMAVAAAAPASQGAGILSMFGFGTSRVDVPLSDALPGVTVPLRSPPVASPKLQTSVLSSGIQVASIESSSPVSTVTLVVEAGSVNESAGTLGASKMLEAMAFKATSNRSTFRLTRELEKLGASGFCKAGRDHTTFGISSVKLHTPEAVELLVDSVLNARYTYWEVRDMVDAVKEELAASLKRPCVVLREALHRAAFDGSLGQPLVLDPSLLDGFTDENLKAFVEKNMKDARMVLAGVGVDHAELKALASPLLPSTASKATPAKSDSVYVGGVLNVVAPLSVMHCALAFEVKGGLSEAALADVAVALLGAEGRSPLPHSQKESIRAFSSLYQGTGLIAVRASSDCSKAQETVDGICKRVEDVAKGVTDAQLKQAKAVALANYRQTAATGPGLVSLLAPSLLATGKYVPADYASKVESLTGAAVAAFLTKAIKSSPSFVTYGGLGSIPRFTAIAKRFA